MSAMATFTCLGIMNVSAGKQVIRSERYGDGYAYGVDQCVSTSESLIGSDGRALFSSTVSHNGNGDQLTDRTYFFYDDKLTTALNQQLKQRNMSSGSEGEVLEFYFDNKSRNFTYYDDNGRAIRSYGQNWRATSAGGEWNKNNTEGWEYDYNAAGQTVGARYWKMYIEGTDPFYTFTLTYDNDGNLKQMVREGAYATSPLKVDLTWENGRLTRMDQMKCKERDEEQNPIWIDDCNFIFNYNADGLLTDYEKYAYLADGSTEGKSKNCFEYNGKGTFAKYSTSLGMSGISYGISETDYESTSTYSVTKKSTEDDGEVIWTNPNQKYVSYWSDLNSADSLTASELKAEAGNGVGEVLVSCVVPVDNKEITATLYRDCEAVMSKTLAEFGEAYNGPTRTLTISDHTSAGIHQYTVALSQPGAEGIAYGYVPAPVDFEVTANLPALANFHIVGAHKEEKTITGDDGEGNMVTQTIVSNIVTVGWDSVSKTDAETYGFNKYEFWSDLYSIATGYTDNHLTSIYNINLEDREEADVWIEVDYGMGRVKSEKIHVVVADYLEKEDATVWGIAKIYNPDFYDSNFCMVKGDLNDTANEPEVLADLYTTDDLEVSDFYGGTNVGEYYYAHMGDDYGRNRLYSLNFTTNEIVPVATFNYGEPGYEARQLAYDEATDKIYAVADVYDEEANEFVHQFMSIDYSDGATDVIANLTETPYLMAAGDGKIYVGVQGGTYGSFTLSLSTVDPATGALTPISDVKPFAISMNEAKAMTFNDGKLYIVIGTSYTVVDLKSGAVNNMPSLKKGYFAFTFKQSTLSAESGNNPVDQNQDTRKVYRKASIGDSIGAYNDSETSEILYYYNIDGNIAREVTRSRVAGDYNLTDEWNIEYQKEYEYNDNGKLAKVDYYQYGQYDMDMDSRELRSSTEYLYDEAGLLIKETETLPSTIAGMSDNVNTVEYTYDENGNIATRTEASNGTVNTEVAYTYDELNRIDAAERKAWGMTTFEQYVYDEAGRLQYITTSDENGTLMNMKAWEYFDNSDIIASEGEYYSFDADNTPTGGFRTVYEPVDGDMNLIHSYGQSLFDGEWTGETGSDKVAYFADFKDMAEQVACELKISAATGINAAKLTFSIPNIVMFNPNTGIRIVRNGDIVATILGEDLYTMIDNDTFTFNWTDELVPNGKNEYFVQTLVSQSGEIEPWNLEINVPEYIGYNISNIAEISFDTELPAVNNFMIIGAETVYVDEYNKPVSNPLLGHEAVNVTISWSNPENMADFGFISNNVYESPNSLRAASVDDPASNEASFIIEAEGSTDIYVRTIYKLGYADSQLFTIDPKCVGVEKTFADDARIIDGILTLDSAADVEVFDLQGRKLIDVRNAANVDLRSAEGVVIIVISREQNKEAIKANL